MLGSHSFDTQKLEVVARIQEMDSYSVVRISTGISNFEYL